MTTIHSFGLKALTDPKVLILGSMPGIASLNANQYYAHPRNAFWPIMASFFDFDSHLPYEDRLNVLMNKHVALWDVMASCEREGSLDSRIKNTSVVPNAIGPWLEEHLDVRGVILNGGKAFQVFKKHFPDLIGNSISPVVYAMPSTSPANAAMNLATKQKHWHSALASVFS